MESVAKGDGAHGSPDSLTRYYAESGTPPGVFLGAGLAGLADGEGVEKGSTVTEEHLFRCWGCAPTLSPAHHWDGSRTTLPTNPLMVRRDSTGRRLATRTALSVGRRRLTRRCAGRPRSWSGPRWSGSI
jgi:hypothetical protein